MADAVSWTLGDMNEVSLHAAEFATRCKLEDMSNIELLPRKRMVKALYGDVQLSGSLLDFAMQVNFAFGCAWKQFAVHEGKLVKCWNEDASPLRVSIDCLRAPNYYIFNFVF